MGIIKRKNKWAIDNTGIAPLIWLGIIAGATIIGSIGVYEFTQRPDITYNIADTGFSLAGIGLDSTTMLIIVGVVVFALFMFMRKK